jgi:hypothetical protein
MVHLYVALRQVQRAQDCDASSRSGSELDYSTVVSFALATMLCVSSSPKTMSPRMCVRFCACMTRLPGGGFERRNGDEIFPVLMPDEDGLRGLRTTSQLKAQVRLVRAVDLYRNALQRMKMQVSVVEHGRVLKEQTGRRTSWCW